MPYLRAEVIERELEKIRFGNRSWLARRAGVSAAQPHVVSVTAGGAGMYCGSCMRDNALAAELIRRQVPITHKCKRN